MKNTKIRIEIIKHLCVQLDWWAGVRVVKGDGL